VRSFPCGHVIARLFIIKLLALEGPFNKENETDLKPVIDLQSQKKGTVYGMAEEGYGQPIMT